MTSPYTYKWGEEFLVNTTTTNSQSTSAVTALADGRFVVVWADYSATGGDTDGGAIRAQIFHADGSKAGAELLVNTTTTAAQLRPSVSALGDGGFAVSWSDYSQSPDDNSSYAIRSQVYGANGQPAGNEFLVNTTTAASQDDSSMATLADGSFVVTWRDGSASGGDTSSYAIRAQLFDADGTKAGDEFLVNTTTTSAQYHPEAGALADGGFVIAWYDYSQSGGDTSSHAIRAQVFDAGGVMY